jgi:hypothetical protein
MVEWSITDVQRAAIESRNGMVVCASDLACDVGARILKKAATRLTLRRMPYRPMVHHENGTSTESPNAGQNQVG